MPLQFRRGTETDVLSIVPAEGEPLWTTDTQKLRIGDGTTSGGIEIGGGGGGGAQGAQGVQGATGAQGAQGFQGIAGSEGTGAQGAQGPQGAEGAKGSQGYQGLQGQKGDTGEGTQGAQGFQGFQGTTGSQGQKGDTGEGTQGAQGFQGLQGLKGAQGDTGSQGVQGAQGPADGAQGFQGYQGNQGNQGTAGTAGPQGSQGFQGFQGPADGAQGFQGHQGNQGVQGAQGFQGLQGEQGIQGAQGHQGAQGSQGFQGFQGHQGVQGSQGFQGEQGYQGFQGEIGAQGHQGYQGDTGAQGFQGHQGVIGAQGDTGAQGFQGFQGVSGDGGVQGAQGLPGSYDQDLYTTSSVRFNIVTATNLLQVNSGTNISRSLVVGGEGVQGDGYWYASAAGTTPALLYVANAASGTQGRIISRTYGQNQPSGGATTIPVAQVIMEGARGTHTSPTAIQNGDPLGGVNWGGYDGSRWTIGDRNLGPAQINVTAAENWSGNTTTATNQGTNFTFRDQPIGMQLNSTSRRTWLRTLQSSVAGAPPTLNLVFNDNAATTPTLTSADGSTTYTGHGRLNLGFVNAQTTVIAVPSTDSSPDNNNLTGTNVVNYYGVRKNGMSGRRNRLQSGDSIFNIHFTGATADNSTSAAGTQFASIIASVIENVSSTAYGSKLTIRTVTSGTTNIADRLSLDSEIIGFGPTKSLQFNADEFSFREATGIGKTFANYTTNSGGTYSIGLNNIQTFTITANEFYLKDKSGNAVIDYMTTTNKVDFVAPIEATTATITSILNLPVLTAEPAGKVDGTLVFADGATWDPASYTNTQYLTYWDGANWKAIANA